MALLPHIIAYLAVGVFVVAVVVRIAMWSRLPMHVRWELYPVAHEASRAHYGGSYLEDAGWWQKNREKSMVGELKVMVPEILFLVALRENNPKLWLRSFPFHFGIYVVVGATGLMIANGLLSVVMPDLLTGGLGSAFQYGTVALAIGGLALGLVGALGLLQRRLGDPELKDFSAPADILNLVLFVVAFGLALAHIVLLDRDLSRSMEVVRGLVTFSPTPLTGTVAQIAFTSSTVILLAILMAYIPLTHMSHFIGKYFAYHAIRWNDAPNIKGGDQEMAINELLQRKVSWAAPHIDAKGKKSWADLATEEVKK